MDDEPDARNLLGLILTSYEAEVLDEWRPDVLVSDIGMPFEDGYELMRKVRAA